MRLPKPVLTALLVVIALATVTFAQASAPVAREGDPFRVTPAQIEAELVRSGIAIEWIRPAASHVPTVAGVASSGGTEIGFEFQLYSSSNSANVRRLGRLTVEDLGWRRTRNTGLFRKWFRGVIANVAYAQYELEPDGPVAGGYLRYEASRRHVIRTLDDALFGAFPSGDPYAHALEPGSAD